MPISKTIYIKNVTSGLLTPVNPMAIKSFIDRGIIRQDTPISIDACKTWRPALDVEGIDFPVMMADVRMDRIINDVDSTEAVMKAGGTMNMNTGKVVPPAEKGTPEVAAATVNAPPFDAEAVVASKGDFRPVDMMPKPGGVPLPSRFQKK